MLKEERLDYILQQLQASPSVKLNELSISLQVSEDTIRRDIETLDKNGLCQKVRGGAVPHSPNDKMHAFKDRLHLSESQKEIIAQKALSLIQPDQTILLDGGTTTYRLACLLPKNLPLTVITNSIPVANALMDHSCIELIMAGGKVFKNSQVTMGLDATRLLENVRADIYFTGICSLHVELGLSVPSYDEAEIKRLMVQRANRVVAITMHDKIGTAEAFNVCGIKAVDTIVTEKDATNELFDPYKKMGVQIF